MWTHIVVSLCEGAESSAYIGRIWGCAPHDMMVQFQPVAGWVKIWGHNPLELTVLHSTRSAGESTAK